MKKWLDQYKNGGNINSLNRKVTCSNCGWSWKLSDGGLDPMTCHKCGGDIKMQNGGQLDKYQNKGEVLTPAQQVALANSIAKNPLRVTTPAPAVHIIKQGYAPTPYTEYVREERNKEYARNKTMQNSDLAKTFSSFTPGGNNIEAGVIGAETFANLNPVMSGPILSASRLAPAIMHPTNNAYWGSDRSIGQNALGVLGAAGDVAMISPYFKGVGEYLTTQTPLKNTYKINPWAFKPNPEAYYRGIGKSGIDDAIESGLLRTANKTGNYGEDLYMTSDFNAAKQGYSRDKSIMEFNPEKISTENPWGVEHILPQDTKSYIAEIPKQELYNSEIQHSFIIKNKGALPINNIKLYKEDWLRGYKEVPKPKVFTEGQPYENISLVNIGKNLEDLQAAKKFAKQYGYELPEGLERIAESDILTDRTIRGLMDRHNTFVRGVSTNWEEIGKRNPEILRHLEGKGFNLSTKEGTKAAAEYMSTHIPINTGYGRASLNNNVFSQGLEGLYTSNSIPTAEGYTYGQGYIVKAKRPTNYSSLNRQDWINLNNPEYYEHKLPGDSQTFKINGKLVHTDDLNTGYMYNLENYENINDFKNKVLFDLQEKADRFSDIIKRKTNSESFINNTKNGLNETLKQIEDIKNSKWEKNLDINFEKKLLKTEHKPGFFGENFGDFGNSAEEISAALSKSSTEQKIHSDNLLNIVKEIGKKQNKEIANLLDQQENLINKTTRTAQENEELKTLENKIRDLRWSGQNEVFQKESEYLSKHFPGWEDKKNMYAHYIHLGTPGEKVLQPIKSWEITPEIWKNKSRAHTNYYTNKLSGMSKGGPIVTNRGQWDYPGQTTIIPSNKITMTGVDYPVLGVDNTGHTKIMQPGMDYTFPGQYVTEYPMAQNGYQVPITNNLFNRTFRDKQLIKQEILDENPALQQVMTLDNMNINYARRNQRRLLEKLHHNPEYFDKDNNQNGILDNQNDTDDGYPYSGNIYTSEGVIKNPNPGEFTTLINKRGMNRQQIKDAAANDFISHSLHYSPQYQDYSNKLNQMLLTKHPAKMIEENGGVDAYMRSIFTEDPSYFPYKEEMSFIDPNFINEIKSYVKGISKKEQGGEMISDYKSGGQHGGLDRWFAEKWVDIKTGRPCGRQEGESRNGYPACRPSKRISSDTPKTSSELSSSERERFKREKTSSERISYNHQRREDGGEILNLELMKSGGNVATNPSLWSRAKSLARQKYDVYPSAYANGWAAKWYKSHGGGWRKAEYGMEVMGDGGVPNNPGFNSLPEYVQQNIINNMATGGQKMPPQLAYARFAAAGNLNQLQDYGYEQGGVVLNTGGEKHRIYVKSTNRGEGAKGHIMVNHPTMDKGMWDTIDLTEKAGATTIAQGVAATKKWHRENPYKKQDGGEEINWYYPKQININEGFSYYEPNTETYYFNPNNDIQNQEAVKQHELYHHLQNINGRLQLPQYYSGPLKKPNMMMNGESQGAYYNRRGIDEEKTYNIMVKRSPELQFVPRDILYNGMQGSNGHIPGTNDMMYENPYTVEGEARDYENYIRAGGKPIFANGGYVVRRSHDRKGKTHVVIGPDGTKKYFGDPNMGERGKSKYGKEAFYARHKKNLAHNPYFRAYARATWEEGGETYAIGGQSTLNPIVKKDNRNWLDYLKN